MAGWGGGAARVVRKEEGLLEVMHQGFGGMQQEAEQQSEEAWGSSEEARRGREKAWGRSEGM